MKHTLIITACAAIALATAANAAGPSDCVKLSKQTADAIATSQSGRAQDQARSLASVASTYCATSMYAQGVARYNQALQILAKG
jgi:hypothetical protein